MAISASDIFTAPSGISGYSGAGVSGTSGYSGAGVSGTSGYSGASGEGQSGTSGYSGDSTSGYSGYSGDSTSGVSGYSGDATSGYSGYSGESGAAGGDGTSGYSGYSGDSTSGYSGYSGDATSGYSGYSGSSGYSGPGGTIVGVAGDTVQFLTAWSAASGTAVPNFSAYCENATTYELIVQASLVAMNAYYTRAWACTLPSTSNAVVYPAIGDIFRCLDNAAGSLGVGTNQFVATFTTSAAGWVKFVDNTAPGSSATQNYAMWLHPTTAGSGWSGTSGTSGYSGTSGSSGAAMFTDNVIINGDFNVWQRGVSFAGPALYAFMADRWMNFIVSTAAYTVTRDTDVPTAAESLHKSNYSFKLDVTTADSSVAASDLVAIAQTIEGYEFQRIAQQPFVLTFWVKAVKTGIYCVSFWNAGGDKAWISEYTINSANTWEKKTIAVDASPTAGTWDYTNGIGLRVFFTIMAGIQYQAAAGSWLSTADTCTSNQVNGVDSTDNNFWLSQVKIEPGSSATRFIGDDPALEMERCQRYFQRVTGLHTLATVDVVGAGYVNHPNYMWFNIPLPTTMRIEPVASTRGSAVDFLIFTGANAYYALIADLVFQGNTDRQLKGYATTAGGLTAGWAGQLCVGSGASGYVNASAEWTH